MTENKKKLTTGFRTLWKSLASLLRRTLALNYPKENALTYEDFTDKEIVLISDEAHHLQTITKKSREEIELERRWEFTVSRIFKSNVKNILLEFTATIDLSNQNIVKNMKIRLYFNTI